MKSRGSRRFSLLSIYLLSAIAGISLILILTNGCYKNNNDDLNPPPQSSNIKDSVITWVTSANQTKLLSKASVKVLFSEQPNAYPVIEINPLEQYQSVDGFGYTLTGGSAYLLYKMDEEARLNLLHHLFDCSDDNACISYLRISIGASDLDEKVFSYDDIPEGETDMTLSHFNLGYDTLYLIPVLKEILQLNPNIKLLGSPWSAPTWMKTNHNSVGGHLDSLYYNVYADYFVKYILAMQQYGITLDAITVQNEPLHGGNNPSMVMYADQQSKFVKNHLGPKFQNAHLKTKIIIWDHNCDNPGYPISILSDTESYPYIDGSAFHLYGGDISALSAVKNQFPDKNLYFTEQWTSGHGNFGEDLQWHIKNVIIGSMRNWSKVALEWNLANGSDFKPHTPGGCNLCLGAITISGNLFTKNVGYYNVAHASRFIPPGSIRIGSSDIANISQVAFLTPQDKKVVLAVNETENPQIFNLKYQGKYALVSMSPHTVATYIF